MKSRRTIDGWVRRRECLDCGRRFNTLEAEAASDGTTDDQIPRNGSGSASSRVPLDAA